MRAFISQRRIKTDVKRLATQIDRACRRQHISELVVVSVMDGAFVFTADLVRAMRTPTRIVFTKASSYRGTTKGPIRAASLPNSLRRQPVLIVDTIYDTGQTIAWVMREARRLTNLVWLAVLIEKKGKSLLQPADQAEVVFSGIELTGDPFLIGYGLDVNGQFRNLPDIHKYRQKQARSSRHELGS